MSPISSKWPSRWTFYCLLTCVNPVGLACLDTPVATPPGFKGKTQTDLRVPTVSRSFHIMGPWRVVAEPTDVKPCWLSLGRDNAQSKVDQRLSIVLWNDNHKENTWFLWRKSTTGQIKQRGSIWLFRFQEACTVAAEETTATAKVLTDEILDAVSPSASERDGTEQNIERFIGWLTGTQGTPSSGEGDDPFVTGPSIDTECPNDTKESRATAHMALVQHGSRNNDETSFTMVATWPTWGQDKRRPSRSFGYRVHGEPCERFSLLGTSPEEAAGTFDRASRKFLKEIKNAGFISNDEKEKYIADNNTPGTYANRIAMGMWGVYLTARDNEQGRNIFEETLKNIFSPVATFRYDDDNIQRSAVAQPSFDVTPCTPDDRLSHFTYAVSLTWSWYNLERRSNPALLGQHRIGAYSGQHQMIIVGQPVRSDGRKQDPPNCTRKIEPIAFIPCATWLYRQFGEQVSSAAGLAIRNEKFSRDLSNVFGKDYFAPHVFPLLCPPLPIATAPE